MDHRFTGLRSFAPSVPNRNPALQSEPGDMISMLKSIWWRGLAACLGWGARLLRRCPSGSRPDEWRAVRFSYSHFGEDLVVFRLLQDLAPDRRGAFVDVGAFDPMLHSNTYLLYLYGWRGLNIDANPARMARFLTERPGDTNVTAAVSDTCREVVFLEYPTPGLSRVVTAGNDKETNALGEMPLAATHCRTQTLSCILKTRLGSNPIDFLNVDCEGLDLSVLRGLDWSIWRPRVVAVRKRTPPPITRRW